MYADLVGLTNTRMTLPVDKTVTIILAFTYEFSSIIGVMEGYILKYVGDAVIAFFHRPITDYLFAIGRQNV
jgi:adenylate cyclase